MNIEAQHTTDKAVSAVPIFKGTGGTTIAIKIKQEETLKEHITKVPALLICISGKAVFENEQGIKEPMSSGDYIEIEPMVKHWVNAQEESNFLLIKS